MEKLGVEKIYNKDLHKVVKQGWGAPSLYLYGNAMNEHPTLQRAADQSIINCDKHLIGGGFNPRSRTEIAEVYGGSRA